MIFGNSIKNYGGMSLKTMNIKDISELPKLMNPSEEFLKTYNPQSDSKEILIRFKEFWGICECPKPIIFIRNGVVFISRDKSRFRGEKLTMSEEMQFEEIKTLPKPNRGKEAKDYLETLQKIPVGKMWIVDLKKYNISTLRKAIQDLETEGKIKKGEYTATQRTVDKKVKAYVLHNAIK